MENNNKSSNARDSVILAVSIIIVFRLMWKFLNRVSPPKSSSDDDEPTIEQITTVPNVTKKKSEKKTKSRTFRKLLPVDAGIHLLVMSFILAFTPNIDR